MKEYTKNPHHINTSKNVYEFIINIYGCLKLKKSSIIINSMIFFHKYYLYNLINNSIIDINNKDFSLLCISCFLLGTKSSNFLMRIDDILKCIYDNNILQNDNNPMENHKKIISYYEYEVLESLGFDIKSYDINLKYAYYIFDIINNQIHIEKDEAKLKKAKEYLIAQIRYSFILPFFLKFNPSTIILSTINIFFKKLKKNIDIGQVISDLKKHDEITLSDVDNFCNLYEFLILRKNTNEVNDKNEINDNKTINMDIIKKINLGNSDNIQLNSSNNYSQINNK